jgi:hypothetical protein
MQRAELPTVLPLQIEPPFEYACAALAVASARSNPVNYSHPYQHSETRMAAASDSAASASDSKAASTDEWSPGEAASFLADLDEDAMKYVSADSLVTLRTAALACEHKKAVAAAKDKLDHVLFLRRWLVARQGEMDKASPMLIRHLQWREEDCPWYPGIPPTETIVSLDVA